MNIPSVTGHMIVKNEDRFLWYAITSILPYLDRLIIYDTGSKDGTLEIIKSFHTDKIKWFSKTVRDPVDLAKLRQEQLDLYKDEWIWIIDGDEVYPNSLCVEIRNLIRGGDKLEGIVVGRFDLLGDIYHYQNPGVGTYELFGKRGHFVLRLIHVSNIPGLHVSGAYPFEGYYDMQGHELTQHIRQKFAFTTERLFHAMYLHRSTLGPSLPSTFHRDKYKIEWGISIPSKIKIPEVFFSTRPEFVSNASVKRSIVYSIIAIFITPIKILKRYFTRILK
ncbi:MAG: glycosyltransferase [Bacteroidota bacterium]